MTSLLPWLMSLAVGLLLFEIAGRRLALWSRLSEVMIPAGRQMAQPASREFDGTERLLKGRQPVQPARENRPAAVIPSATPVEPTPASPAAEVSSAASIFEQAKRRAKKRLNE
jgi:hypothetical protein